MSPEKPTPQHDDEAGEYDHMCWRSSEADCCICVREKGHESTPDAKCAHGSPMNCRTDELTAALDLIGRRTDIVAVQLPEPDNGIWYIDDNGGNVHAGSAGNVLLDAWSTLWAMPADKARALAAALLAAASRADAANVADAAEGEAK